MPINTLPPIPQLAFSQIHTGNCVADNAYSAAERGDCMVDRNAVVLVVDDILSIVEELLTLLDLHDIPAAGAQTLSEVAQVLEQSPHITVIVSDIRLRHESGLEIPQRIRENIKLKDRCFKYIFVSGDNLQMDQISISDHQSFLTKPVQPKTLITLVAGLLDTQSR